MCEGGLVGSDSLRGAVDWVEMHGRSHVRRPRAVFARRDRRVGELGGEVGFPVFLHTLRDEIVEGTLPGEERHHLHELSLHLRDVGTALASNKGPQRERLETSPT
jgi:hypothetical protein